MSLISELEAAGVVVEDDLKAVGALILKALKVAGKDAEQAFLASIPGAAAALAQYAKEEVAALEANPAFKNALGGWKFGTAAALVLQALERDFPQFEALGKGLLTAAIETAVQAALAALVAGL